MDAFLQMVRNLGPMRLAVMGGVVLGLIGFFIFLTTRLTTPQMSLLYGDLQQDDSASIVNQLESMSVPFELKRGGAEIHVPSDRALRLRLSMAERGLPSGGSVGYELFDRADSLGTTNFVQNVNLVRALEGELARTIGSLNSVKSARVHLVMPKRELFSREKQEPSAAVILNMRGATRVDSQQVLAIQHLVAASIPGLVPNRISIVDEKGALLARGFEGDDTAAAMAARGEEMRRGFELRTAKALEQLLERTVGFGNVRAEVTAELDFDRISTSEEQYDPDGQVVRSTQSIEETVSSRESEANQSVSVGQNLPDPSGGGDSASTSAAESRTEETVNFEITKKVVNHVRETGAVKRISVAVLVDGRYTLNDNGDRAYQPRSDEDLELIRTLVTSAIGFNSDRGDIVEIVNMRFATAEEPEEEALELFFGFNKNDLLRVAEILVLSIVSVLVILLVVRPLLSRAFEALPAAAGAMAAQGRLLAEQAAGAPALVGPGGVTAPGEGMLGEEEGFDEMIDLDRVEGRVKASSVKKVGEIVTKHPEEAVSILRNWMYQQDQ